MCSKWAQCINKNLSVKSLLLQIIFSFLFSLEMTEADTEIKPEDPTPGPETPDEVSAALKIFFLKFELLFVLFCFNTFLIHLDHSNFFKQYKFALSFQ